MNDPAFWRNLERQFLVSGDRARDVYAILDEINVQAFADTVIALMHNPWSSLDKVYRSACVIKWAAEAAREDPDGQWVITGGPRDNQERHALRVVFRLLATRAAIAADLVAVDVSPEQAVQAWLHLLKRSNSPYLNAIRLERLFDASALRCHELWTGASIALVRELASEGRKVYISPLAANIDKFRRECGWTIAELVKAIELVPDAVLDHVDKGARPRPDALKSYADAFTDKLGRVVSVEELKGSKKPS
jgi:hypothetical protein